MIAEQPIRRAQRMRYAYGGRFLADAEMTRTARRAGLDPLGELLLDRPDEQHVAQEVQQVRRCEAGRIAGRTVLGGVRIDQGAELEVAKRDHGFTRVRGDICCSVAE